MAIPDGDRSFGMVKYIPYTSDWTGHVHDDQCLYGDPVEVSSVCDMRNHEPVHE